MDAELIAFPDSEDVIRTFLAAELDADSAFVADLGGEVAVYATALPASLPGASVLVRRTGGISWDLVVDEPQVTLEARSVRGDKAAHDLASWVRTRMNAAGRAGAMAGVACYGVRELSGPYPDPDPVNPSQARYSATSTVSLRGTSTTPNSAPATA